MAKKQKTEKKPQFRKSCIFCDGHGLTEEHILGDWIRKIIPRNQNRHHSFKTFVTHTPNGRLIEPVFREKQGNMGNKRLKIVCASCNNEWLSNNFENAVKPCISEMILGHNVNITPDDQRTIALWVTKTCMVYEFDQPTRRGIPKSDLRFLRDHTQVPAGWKVWIGKYTGESNLRLRHNCLGMFKSTKEMNAAYKPESNDFMNAQTTIILIGKLVLFALSGPADIVATLNLEPHLDKLELIWPQTNNEIIWPSRMLIDDEQLIDIADYYIPFSSFLP